MARDITDSPVRGRGSPRRRSPSRRERSPARHRSSHKTSSPLREKPSSRTKSPRREKLRSPEKSLSPRTNRSRRAEAGRESERSREKEHRRDREREDERAAHKERSTERQVSSERKEKRSGRDEVDRAVSKPRLEQSSSPSDRHHKSRRCSPQLDSDMREVSGDIHSLKQPVKESRGAEHRNGDVDSVAKMKAAEEALSTKEKEKPSFELSGKLAAETNRVRGITLLFNEPPEARKPDIRWRLYVFKGGEVLNEPLYVHRQSYYLFGRERRVADIPTDHPSCSKQHAVLQYRQVEKEQSDGTMVMQVRPYVMDLGSTNGTFINDNRLEPQRYYEILEKDTIKFGNSSREYVMLHENSAS